MGADRYVETPLGLSRCIDCSPLGTTPVGKVVTVVDQATHDRWHTERAASQSMHPSLFS